MTLVLPVALGLGALAVFVYALCFAEEELMPRVWRLVDAAAQGPWRAHWAAARVALMVIGVVVCLYVISIALHDQSIQSLWKAEVSFAFVWVVAAFHLSVAEGGLANVSRQTKAGRVAMDLSSSRQMRSVRRDATLIFAALFLLLTVVLVGNRVGLSPVALEWLGPFASGVLSAIVAAGRILSSLLGSVIAAVLLIALIAMIVRAERSMKDSAYALADQVLGHTWLIVAATPVGFGGTGNMSLFGENTGMMTGMLDVLLDVEERVDQAYLAASDRPEIDLCKTLPQTALGIFHRLEGLNSDAADGYRALIEGMVKRLRDAHRTRRVLAWQKAAEAVGVALAA